MCCIDQGLLAEHSLVAHRCQNNINLKHRHSVTGSGHRVKSVRVGSGRVTGQRFRPGSISGTSVHTPIHRKMRHRIQPFKVTEVQRNWHRSIGYLWLHEPVEYRFQRDTCQKLRIIPNQRLFQALLDVLPLGYCIGAWSQKLEWLSGRDLQPFRFNTRV